MQHAWAITAAPRPARASSQGRAQLQLEIRFVTRRICAGNAVDWTRRCGQALPRAPLPQLLGRLRLTFVAALLFCQHVLDLLPAVKRPRCITPGTRAQSLATARRQA